MVVVGDAEVGEVIRAVVGGVVVEVGDLAALLSKVAVEAEAEAAAAAALDEAEGITPAATAAVAAAPNVGGLTKPFIQIGIFSVEANAKNTAESLRRAGMVPTVKKGTSAGKSFWRVIVGPATSSSERAALLRKIKDLGFGDAYYVTN